MIKNKHRYYWGNKQGRGTHVSYKFTQVEFEKFAKALSSQSIFSVFLHNKIIKLNKIPKHSNSRAKNGK